MDSICYHCKIRVKAEEYSEHTKKCWGQRFSCKLCDKTFKEALYLKRHTKKFHEDTDQRTQKNEVEDTQGMSNKDSQKNDREKPESSDEDWDKAQTLI